MITGSWPRTNGWTEQNANAADRRIFETQNALFMIEKINSSCPPMSRCLVPRRGLARITLFHHGDTVRLRSGQAPARRKTLNCHPELVRRRRTGEGPYNCRATCAVNGIHDGVRGEEGVVLHNAVERAYLDNDFSIPAKLLSRTLCSTSRTEVSNPAIAETCAMPEPIGP